MSLLSEEKIDDLSREMVKGGKSVNWLASKIEAAVLEAQVEQEPVGYFSKEERDHYEPIWEEVSGPEFGVPLFAAPVVQPGMVPREPTLAMLNCLRADTTPNLEKRYHAMIAAAEVKE